jgi:hypothetical protein
MNKISFYVVDGGPDENSRYQQVIETAIHHKTSTLFSSLLMRPTEVRLNA